METRELSETAETVEATGTTETAETTGEGAPRKPPDKIAWHPGFYGGLELELRRWKEDLIFQEEHTLSKQPLKMDMLIIKKSRDVVIDFSYGRAFRKYNVVEYKSPEDTLSIDAFYKTIGYACLYKGTGETENAIPDEEVTVTLFCFHANRELQQEYREVSAMTEQQIESLIFGNRLEEVREEERERFREERERTVLDMLCDRLPLNRIIKYSKLSHEKIMEIAQSNGIAVVTG